MSPVFRRNRRARAAAGADAPYEPLEPDSLHEPHPADGDASSAVTAEQPAADDASGTDLDALVGEAPTSRRRGRLRRRLRHLRRVREVLLRDLGGLVFELYRSGADGRTGDPLVEGKLTRLAAVAAEIRELEALLDDHRPLVVREPGIGGSCPECGELFGSEARFCWACGSPVASGAGAGPLVAPAAVGAPQLPAPDADADAHPGSGLEAATHAAHEEEAATTPGEPSHPVPEDAEVVPGPTTPPR